MRRLIGGVVNSFADFHFEPLMTHHADRAVIVEGRMTGTDKKEWAGIPPLGKKMDVLMACVVDFDGDMLIKETVYFDVATLQRQLGPGPEQHALAGQREAGRQWAEFA